MKISNCQTHLKHVEIGKKKGLACCLKPFYIFENINYALGIKIYISF